MAFASRCVRSLTAFLIFAGTGLCAETSALREQLALATEDANTLAQIELLRRILEAEPTDREARARLLELWLAVPDYDLAASTLADGKDIDPSLVARVNARIQWRRDGDPSGAATTLRTHLATSPNDAPALTDLASLFAATGQWQEQIATLDSLIALDSDNVQARLDRAAARRQTGAFAEAVTDARAAQKLDPDNSAVTSALPAYERLATALEKITRLDARLVKNPDDLTARLLRAWYFADADIWERALQDAETALALAPDSASARITQARALNRIGKIDGNEAVQQFAVNVAAAPENERTAAALIDADTACLADPKSAALLAKRARLLNSETGQFALALRDADAALAMDSDATAAATEAIIATARLDRIDDATARLRTLIAMQPPKSRRSEAAAVIAEAAFRQYQFELAIEFADQALAAVETPPVLRIKALSLQRLGRGDEATPLLQRAEKLEARP